MNKDGRCCGNCYMFKYEDYFGVGICDLTKFGTDCESHCSMHKEHKNIHEEQQ